MKTDGTLERAIEIAARAHTGQRDKAGQPYVLHPLRVMLGVKSELGRIAAVLHDVVEDTDITLSDLRREGFSDEVVGIVDLLTQRDGEQDLDYWARIRTDRVAVEVKLADLRDNMDRSRIARFTTEDARRLEKYQKAWTFLNGEPGRKQTHGGRPARRPEGHPAEPDPHRGVRKDE